MFCSGADQGEFELRAASLKGALAFWWRALAHARFHGDLARIHAEQTRIFGGSENGQGTFLLRCRPPQKGHVKRKNELFPATSGKQVGSGITYLGYGLMAAFDNVRKQLKKGQLSRPCLLAPDRFEVELLFRKEIDTSVLDALRLLGLLGGLGSRVRKGFGSLCLESIAQSDSLDKPTETIWQAPNTVEDYRREIVTLVGERPAGLPAYTAFSAASRITLLAKGTDALQLLNAVGETLQLYRSWGRHGKVNGQPAEQNFKQDHDLVYAAARGEKVATHPARVAFGLPHNYFLSGTGSKINIDPADWERRASPLWLHIHKLANEYVAVATLLPAVFLPDGDIRINVIKGPTLHVPPRIDDAVLHGFIDGRRGPAGAKTRAFYFPEREDLLPVLTEEGKR